MFLQVFHLMESIELVTKCHLHVKNLRMLASDANIHKLIINDVLQSESVLAGWETVSYHIPAKYESYKMELLENIEQLHLMSQSITCGKIRAKTPQFAGTLCS